MVDSTNRICVQESWPTPKGAFLCLTRVLCALLGCHQRLLCAMGSPHEFMFMKNCANHSLGHSNLVRSFCAYVFHRGAFCMLCMLNYIEQRDALVGICFANMKK